MAVEVSRQMNQVRKDIRGIGKKQQPRAGKSQKTPTPTCAGFEFLASQEREEQRQPRKKQVPNQKSVLNVPCQGDAQEDQRYPKNRSKQQRKHRDCSLTLKGQSQDLHKKYVCSTLNLTFSLNLRNAVLCGLVQIVRPGSRVRKRPETKPNDRNWKARESGYRIGSGDGCGSVVLGFNRRGVAVPDLRR